MQPASTHGEHEAAQVWGGPQSQARALQMHGGQDSLERVRSCSSLEQTKVTRKLNRGEGGYAGGAQGVFRPTELDAPHYTVVQTHRNGQHVSREP